MKKDADEQDKAGKQYWDKVWHKAGIPEIIEPHRKDIGGVINCAVHEFYQRYFKKAHEKSLFLEVGCGNSSFLPYVKKEYGFDIYGLDYSEIGCEMAKRVMKHYGVQGKIILGDMFNPPVELLEKFDIVASIGVIEHFTDTKQPCVALERLVKKGGMVVTEIPNFAPGSICGRLQKTLNREVYDKHMFLTKENMQEAHEAAGFSTVYCDYTIGMNFGVVNFKAGQKHLSKFLTRLGKAIMYIRKDRVRGSKLFSPYIYYVGVKN